MYNRFGIVMTALGTSEARRLLAGMLVAVLVAPLGIRGLILLLAVLTVGLGGMAL